MALVTRNSVYQKVAPLANPANDATAIAEMLKSAVFDSVESKFNVAANDLRKTLREFGTKSREADVAVVYYAGHGIELDGNNYLIPVDATLETDADVLDETGPDPAIRSTSFSRFLFFAAAPIRDEASKYLNFRFGVVSKKEL